MAAPELVICPPSVGGFKSYPGGIIVLRAADWMGAARGTLSSEADARSCCGTVVREQQQTATSLYDTERITDYTAYDAMDDTLVIDLADLPIESGIVYQVFLSVLIEGDWDATNPDTTRGGDQEEFRYACSLGMSSPSGIVDGFGDVATLANQGRQWRGLDSYRIVDFGGSLVLFNVVGDEVLTLKAYSQAGTTIEYLIDQLYFVPSTLQNGGDPDDPNWDSSDFQVVEGYITGDDFDLTDDVDGADGGDDQGKFTWHPFHAREDTGFGAGSAGDYQRKADESDAEYMARVTADGTGYALLDSATGDEPSRAHCYGLHGPYHIPSRDWVMDEFDRTVGDGNFAGADGHFATQIGWGTTDEGFAWEPTGAGGGGPFTGAGSVRYGTALWADGSSGAIRGRAEFQDELWGGGLMLHPTGVNLNPGAQISSDIMRASGTFTWDIDVTASDPDDSAVFATIQIGPPPTAFGEADLRLVIYVYFQGSGATFWEFFNTYPAGATPDATDTFAFTNVGWRIELLRYLVRLKVWDADGAEPPGWTYETFRRISGGLGDLDYDYSDDLEYSIQNYHLKTLSLSYLGGFVTLGTGPSTGFYDDVRVWFDGINDDGPERTYFTMEQPEGDIVGEIEVPAACQHFVYWGARDWTELDSFGDSMVEFSAKCWNHPDAAELQRTSCQFWWFRTARGGIVVMNWRSADRNSSSKRVLVGSRAS